MSLTSEKPPTLRNSQNHPHSHPDRACRVLRATLEKLLAIIHRRTHAEQNKRSPKKNKKSHPSQQEISPYQLHVLLQYSYTTKTRGG